MRLPRQSRRKYRGARTQPVILFVVGEQRFAIAASAVTEIQGLQELKALSPHGVHYGKVHHTVKRDGRRYWVVDANIHFGMMPTHSSRVLMLADSPVAVKVDAIVRMAEIGKMLPLPHSFQGDERNWYLGLTLLDDTVVPVVNPASFLSRFEMESLEKLAPICTSSAEAVGVTA